MKKAQAKTVFRCQNCGYSTVKWLGKCPECESWNTLVEEMETTAPSTARRRLTAFTSEVSPLAKIQSAHHQRVKTGLVEFDRMMGGGVVGGSLTLLGGPPGIGKSTLMLQAAEGLAAHGTVLYVSGEESLEQVKSRADRLGVKSEKLLLLSETNLANILEAVTRVQPLFLIVDSIQTVYKEELSSAPGSVGQVRECAAEFLHLAKGSKVSVFLLGHVTKEGDIAGPRVLEHIVDSVLYFEEEQHHAFRVLRAMKNRFGSTHESGLFEMKESGLEGVSHPSRFFLNERSLGGPGTVVVAPMEGSRPLLLEVQALVARTSFGYPRRQVTGLELSRVLLLIGVLEKRLRYALESQDVFVNVVGGIRIKETGVDLGVALAIASAFEDFPFDHETLAVGEVGLTGEVRSVSRIVSRLEEAQKLGFKRAVVPKRSLKDLPRWKGLDVLGVEHLSQAVELLKSIRRSSPDIHSKSKEVQHIP